MVCACTLPHYYGPDVCKTCPNYSDFNPGESIEWVFNYPTISMPVGIGPDPETAHKPNIKLKKITEKFDINGNLIERIVEESIGNDFDE